MSLLCDRCLRETDVLVPWTRDLNNNRVLMKCCLRCESEMTVRLLIVVGPGEEDEAAEVYGALL